MRYRASEKLEIIRLVEQPHLGVGSTLDKLGIPKTTFYHWYDRFLAFGDAGLEDRNSSPITTDSRHSHAIAPNLLDRNFEAVAPDAVWLADISYITTDEGWLYLAAVKDLATMEIVGWSMSERLKSVLCEEALKMAIRSRRLPMGLIHHSDRGVQYACGDYRKLLRLHGNKASMSRKGNCLDNAPMESFFGSLKTELVHRTRFSTRREAKAALFEYIEIYMDASRLQGMIWCVGTTGCSSISGLFVQDFCLLAPMEFADPRLILLKGFSPSSRCRLSGSQSDLFAITPCRTLRNLSACHFLCQFFISVVSRA